MTSPALLRLPPGLANFARRGFRVDTPARTVLERHAESFLTGFNLAVRHWRDPHPVLREVEAEERGFAYEGAGMFAGLLDLHTAGVAKALRRLLSGPGDAYVHLVHVGAGWLFTPMRIPVTVRLPGTPLLRWLALDGAGFGEVYFGGVRALHRRAARTPSDKWEVRLAGCGRALWFAEAADPAGVSAVIAAAAEEARPHLWAGVGLACGYAGAVDDRGRRRLLENAGRHEVFFKQGVVFAAAARARSGIVPTHTEDACAQLLGVNAATARDWAAEAAEGLTGSRAVTDFLTWKARLRVLVAGDR